MWDFKYLTMTICYVVCKQHKQDQTNIRTFRSLGPDTHLIELLIYIQGTIPIHQIQETRNGKKPLRPF